jgi:hypothetical protein
MRAWRGTWCQQLPLQKGSKTETSKEWEEDAGFASDCMLLDDSSSIRDRRASNPAQCETTVAQTRIVVWLPSVISAYYSMGIGET